MNEFDDLMQLYKTKFNGYCVYSYEKWQHAHLSEYRESYELGFQFHDRVTADSIEELITKAAEFKKKIEEGILDNGVLA